MFITINNLEQLFRFLESKGITAPDEIVDLLSDNDVIVAPDVAQLILEAA